MPCFQISQISSIVNAIALCRLERCKIRWLPSRSSTTILFSIRMVNFAIKLCVRQWGTHVLKVWVRRGLVSQLAILTVICQSASDKYNKAASTKIICAAQSADWSKQMNSRHGNQNSTAVAPLRSSYIAIHAQILFDYLLELYCPIMFSLVMKLLSFDL